MRSNVVVRVHGKAGSLPCDGEGLYVYLSKSTLVSLTMNFRMTRFCTSRRKRRCDVSQLLSGHLRGMRIHRVRDRSGFERTKTTKKLRR